MANFVTWGVVGLLSGAALFGVFWQFWSTPEREQARRAKRNQQWVRDALKRHRVVGVEEEARLIAKFYGQMEDVWKHLESR